MTQQQGEQDEVRWSSESGEEAPRIFSKVAERLGKTLATVSINPRGQETNREDHGGSKASLGMGALSIALPGRTTPSRPVLVHPSRNPSPAPRMDSSRSSDSRTVHPSKSQIRCRRLIHPKRPLTPIDEESVQAQVVQQLSNGTIRFDVDGGHMISKELNWDETVVGFQRCHSMMEYRARLPRSSWTTSRAPRDAERIRSQTG